MARSSSRKPVSRSPSKKRRLEKRRLERETRERQAWEDEGRIVCERCGLEQRFRAAGFHEELAPCEGPLGLACTSETAITPEAYLDG